MKIKNLNIIFLSFLIIQALGLFKLNSMFQEIQDLHINKKIETIDFEDLDFYKWYKECNENNIDETVFIKIMSTFNTACLSDLKTTEYWPITRNDSLLKKLIKIENFKNSKAQDLSIFPHVSALISNELETTYVIGDLHGNFEDLCEILKYFIEQEKIMGKDLKLEHTNIIFLGDYTDRGKQGLETLTTAMLLKIINPEKVFLIRGNHEIMAINFHYGFLEEISKKTKKNHLIVKNLMLSYELMPAALYLTTDKNQQKFVHFSHGGVELRYNPNNFLKHLENNRLQFSHINILKRQDLPELLKKNHLSLFKYLANTDPLAGFLWNDILLENKEPTIKNGSRLAGEVKYNEKFLNLLLQEYGLEKTFIKFIRGHEHELPKEEIEKRMQLYFQEPSSGTTNLKNKIVTLISATINYSKPRDPTKYYPTFLKLTPNNIGEYGYETISIIPTQ